MKIHLEAIRTGLCILGLGAAIATPAAMVPNSSFVLNSTMMPCLSVTNVPGFTHQIEYSTDLSSTQWTPLTNVVVVESPDLANQWFFDVDAQRAPQRFYRAARLANNTEASTATRLTVSSGTQTLSANQPVALNVVANTANTATFSLVTTLTNMQFTPSTGLIAWPQNSGLSSNYTITVIVSDGGNPPNTTTTSFNVTLLNKPNTPPTFPVGLPAYTINVGQPWSTSFLATDADLPTNTLSYSLISYPTGMAIDPSNGRITWTPTTGPSTNNITVSVTDNGTPPLSATTNFTVKVNPVSLIPAGMALVKGGSFIRGDSNDKAPTNAPNGNPTNVFVSGFYMDTNLVSYALWQQVYQWAINKGYSFSNAASKFGANDPVQTVSWYDAVKWCNARSEMEGNMTACYYTSAIHNSNTVYRTGTVILAANNVDWAATGYRLPTEAEWEKAARGNTNSILNRFPLGNKISQTNACYTSPQISYLYDLGPFSIVRNRTTPVGSFPPNGYGLFDMAGNVNAWCWDWYDAKYYSSTASRNDPQGPASGSRRVMRGGSWQAFANNLRCADRQFYTPTMARNFIGFRCVRTAAD